jgi:CDP-glycerol glycerophosphotransferase (TagB/SpsB family)
MEEKVKGYKYSDSIRVVYNQEELERAIRECKNSSEEKRKKYLESELESLDGKASERIASFINNLILEDKDD